MPYKKRFKSPNTDGQFSPIAGHGGETPTTANFGFRNYESSLPEVYTGHPNR
jgi:hypothetical protein